MKFNGAYRNDLKMVMRTGKAVCDAEKEYQKMQLRHEYEAGLIAGGCIVMALMSLLVIFIVAGVK